MIWALAIALAWTQEPPPKEAPKAEKKPVYTALVGGDVHTVTKGVIKNGTVLFKDDKIHRVGASVDLPEGTTRIDTTGRRVLPGLVAVSSRGLAVQGGSGGKVSDAVDPYSESIKLALAGGVTSAHVELGGGGGMFGGGSSAGATAVVKMTYGTLDGMVLLEPASGWLGGWLTGGPSERYEIRENFQKARDQVGRERDFERRRAENRLKPNEQAPRALPAVEPFVKYLKGELIARFPSGDADQIKKALELVNDYKFKAVLTNVVEGWTMAEEIGRARAYCTLTPRTKQHPERNTGRPTGSSIEQAAILRKAGVKFGVISITQGVSTGGIAGRDLINLPIEAAFAIRGGLDEQAALESITITAAEICGVDTRVGSIEEGKDADVIVVDGDPFDYRTFVDLTFVNGKLLYDKAKSPYFSHLKSRK
ncbi:MAG TPA: amidohydrolase family protein [Planctomycetota bacterium]|nr:amidohydrolase family protein [Planctomycetota bacterium]